MQPVLNKSTLGPCNLIILLNMTKTLRVINPFFVMDTNDIFEFDENSNMYVSKHKEEFYKMDDGSINEIKSSYNSEFQISEEYAKTLIEEGYLEEVNDTKPTFVNIFDKIDSLLEKYKNELSTIDTDTVDLPACVKVEKQAVLTNMITLLEYLKGLKK